jgi:imidazolonepropionase-like amidohydrolase
LAINKGKIAAISTLPLMDIETIDASGLVILPVFVDLHSHALFRLAQQLQATDGATTALSLEAVVCPIDTLLFVNGL